MTTQRCVGLWHYTASLKREWGSQRTAFGPVLLVVLLVGLLSQHWHSASGNGKANQRVRARPCQKFDVESPLRPGQGGGCEWKASLPQSLVKYAVHAGAAFSRGSVWMRNTRRTLHTSCRSFSGSVHLWSAASLRCDETSESLKQPDAVYCREAAVSRDGAELEAVARFLWWFGMGFHYQCCRMSIDYWLKTINVFYNKYYYRALPVIWWYKTRNCICYFYYFLTFSNLESINVNSFFQVKLGICLGIFQPALELFFKSAVCSVECAVCVQIANFIDEKKKSK